MPGRLPSLKTLETRKQLLAAEAEVHRTEMRSDMEIVRTNLQNLGHRAKSAGSIVSVLALTVAAVSSLRRRGKVPANGRVSLLSRVLVGARVVAKLWRTIRPEPS